MKRLKGIIYYIENDINNKMYIGQTISKFSHRINQHKSLLRNGTHYNEYLQNSWNKYKEDHFSFKILETHETMKDLNEAEAFYIEFLKTMSPKGYNLEHGGNNYTVSEDTKIKMRKNWVSGMTDEVKNKISKTLVGRKVDKEVIEKTQRTRIQKGLVEKSVSAMKKANSKKVLQFDLDNNFIKEYESSAEASRQANISNGYLCRTLNGEFKSAKGFIWRYKNG